MGLFDKLKGPIFLKESSSAMQQLEALEELDGRVAAKDQKQLEQDIKMLNWGIKGEEQIAFELKNSHMPMYVLHDLYYEEDGLSAQFEKKKKEDNEVLIKALKAYRLEQSRKEKVKPYFIFNDKQMMELIEKKPASIEELIQLSGFGEVKCNKYGAAILEILLL